MATKTEVRPVMKTDDLRTGYCSKCQQPIFKLTFDDCERIWWHEAPALDFQHRPVPGEK